MKYNSILFVFCVLLTSYKIDLEGPWIETQEKNIILYTRPAAHSRTPSPDSSDITGILKNQPENFKTINSFLKTDFYSVAI
jgi:hypothetical protein